ncbi:ANTAR domain-containing protein [Kribbella sp. NBC_00482]|uniref:ANTAR domain-containing protein n=1 Tax=Kribbella sp. NBC_00482 TaxID=2975968 RepID=UPI002E18A9B9
MESGLSAWIRPARERADAERARAARAAAIARRHEERMATASETTRAVHERMARIHHALEERHLTAARLHDTHVRRLTQWFVTEDAAADRRPRLISAIAELLGARSVGITLLNSQRITASAIASDAVAAAAQDLEVTLGEGPVHDATASSSLVVVPKELLPRRWRHYSPAISELGVHSLAVAPLGVRGSCVGALAVFDPASPEPARRLTKYLQEIADALTHTMLLTRTTIAQLAEESPPDGMETLLEAPDFSAVVHQATGMVAAQVGCNVADALALIKARAFVDNEQVSTVARQLVDRRLRLETP